MTAINLGFAFWVGGPVWAAIVIVFFGLVTSGSRAVLTPKECNLPLYLLGLAPLLMLVGMALVATGH